MAGFSNLRAIEVTCDNKGGTCWQDSCFINGVEYETFYSVSTLGYDRIVSDESSFITPASNWCIVGKQVEGAKGSSCRMSISPTSVEVGDPVTISISELVVKDEVGFPTTGNLRLVIPESGKSYEISRSDIQGDSFSKALTNDGSGQYLFADGKSNTVKLEAYWGTHVTIDVCTSFDRVSVLGETCTLSSQVTKNPNGTFNLGVAINTSKLKPANQYAIVLDTGPIGDAVNHYFYPPSPDEANGVNFAFELGNEHQGKSYTLFLRHSNANNIGAESAICSTKVSFTGEEEEAEQQTEKEVIPDPPSSPIPVAEINAWELCKSQLEHNPAAMTACMECKGVWTALGCISGDTTTVVGTIITLGVGIAGGIALLVILFNAFLLTVSQGDVKKTSDARDSITAAVIGLLFIIFSVTILQFIGVEILKIPGFGE